ncbi:SDR family NAD(P)-dependent oxidoreductase [Alteromonas sp. C1M14]|uniref:SDR family NAD(P)-dependent oxidoreductase n=1 Tax=Alteromonas sp. C1M14 TaxID=2841567 RepID=UPI001C0A4411|nr:SDR family NAD(P)-dependent oxidoreductase [Alteromonas sp. C1M14]MBU2979052.1 SDR family NAD(P)-dependent oxidoreductase [Alteromonas sp. C1M14]
MKTILVTGATSGIGKAFTLHAAEQGYNIIACGRNEEVLNALSASARITTKKFDLTSLDDTKAALASVQFDIAVLNAGNCEYVDVENFDTAMFRRVFEINFFGMIHSVEALLPHLRPHSQLVIVDSMARLFPFTRSQAYGASKAAVHYFTQSLNVDLAAKQVLVQHVSPGFIDTPLTEKNDFDMPMKISAEQAAKAMLKGIEKKKQNLYFPSGFGWIMRFLHVLPTGIQQWLSKKMRQQQ